MAHKLYEFSVEILDDSTFSEEEMVQNFHEALTIHLECVGLNVTMNKVSIVILDHDGEIAEA